MAARSGHRGDLSSPAIPPLRLKSNRVFGTIHRRGRWLRGVAVSVGVLGNESQDTRIGIRTKRGIKRAVDRNRLKRQLRGMIFQTTLRFKGGVDLVVVAHPKTIPALASVLREELFELLRRAGVLRHEERGSARRSGIS